jgi:hypothetical protein
MPISDCFLGTQRGVPIAPDSARKILPEAEGDCALVVADAGADEDDEVAGAHLALLSGVMERDRQAR